MAQWQSAIAPLDPNPLAVIDPFFYQVWLGIAAKITMGLPLAVGVYSGLLSALTPWVWYRFFRESLPSKTMALLGWAILCWLPSWIGIFSYLMPETVLLPLIGASLWMTWRSFRKRTLESFVWCTLFWTASCLTKMTVVPLAGISLGVLIALQPAKKRRLAIVAGLLLVCAVPLGYRAYKILGIWAPFGYPLHNRIYMASGAETLDIQVFKENRLFKNYRFTSASTQVEPFQPLWNWRSSRTGICQIQVHLDNGARDWEAALKQSRAPLGRRLRMQLENAVFTLWGPSWPDMDRRRFWEWLTYHSRWIWALLLGGVILMNAAVFRKERRIPLLPLLTVVGWLMILLQPVAPAEGRYRKPFEGLLIGNALWLAAGRGPSRGKGGPNDLMSGLQ
jgi:hypothetical protein